MIKKDVLSSEMGSSWVTLRKRVEGNQDPWCVLSEIATLCRLRQDENTTIVRQQIGLGTTRELLRNPRLGLNYMTVHKLFP